VPIGTEVGLSLGDSVLDGDPAHLFSAHVYCGQTASCIKMPLGTKGGLGQDDIVLDGTPKKGHSPPNFRPMSIVAKRLYVSAYHLVRR